MQTIATLLWRRLDAPGHDACRLERSDLAWQLDGAAVFRHANGGTAQLHYRVRCDRQWHTQSAIVRGWLGDSAVDLAVTRGSRGWVISDQSVPELSHCVDLDLGFTPATHLLQLRRLNLAVGESAKLAAATLDLRDGSLGLLAQHYQRLSTDRYSYGAPQLAAERAELAVNEDGFVLDCPGRWVSEALA